MKSSVCKTLAILILYIFQCKLCESYKVAVVEYHQELHDGFEANIKYNLKNYLNIIKETTDHHQNIDIIVFPESTLVFQTSPYTKQELLQHSARLPIDNATIACLQSSATTSHYIIDLSCAARTHNVYISANVIEKTDSGELFNTNIVFDRQGRLVSRYRKMKPLALERFIQAGKSAEYFETDFGVKFGVFICFDVFFRDSFQELIDNNVQAVIFPSHWYSELPFLSSVQVQNMWSFLHDKVLLASGANNGRSGTGGSGVYTGRTTTPISYLSSSTRNKILVTEILSKSAQKTKSIEDLSHSSTNNHVRELDNFNFIAKRPEMNIRFLNKQQENADVEETLCHNRFCCKFKLNVNATDGLALTIYNGLQPFIGFGNLGIQLCAVVQCQEDNCFAMPKRKICGKTFRKLEVQVLNTTETTHYYPNIALHDLLFLRTEMYEYNGENSVLKLKEEIGGIYTFGFYGRNYKQDEL